MYTTGGPIANDFEIAFLMLVALSIAFMAWFFAGLVRERRTQSSLGRVHLVVKIKQAELVGEQWDSSEVQARAVAAGPVRRVS